ncbi:MAG: glycosyltransferase family 9 protein [Planctomycetota bacterium]
MSDYLLIRLSSLGDVLFALAVVDRLREAQPRSRISFLVEDRFAAIPRAHPGIDEVLVVPRTEGWPAVFANLKNLRRRRFDAVIDLQGNAKSALHLAALRGSLRIGFARGAGREANFLFVNKRVAPPPEAVHRADRFLTLLSALGIEPTRAAPTPLQLSNESVERAEKILSKAGAMPKVILHPGTSAFGLLKRWEPERFGRLAKQLSFVPGAASFITGAPGEELLVHAAEEASCGGALGLPPLPSLLDLTALLARADAVVAADTGPLHLANRMGTPSVALFGPKDTKRYGPVYPRSVVIRREDVPCSPCTRRWCEAPACMAGITVETVAFEVRRLLTSKK